MEKVKADASGNSKYVNFLGATPGKVVTFRPPGMPLMGPQSESVKREQPDDDDDEEEGWKEVRHRTMPKSMPYKPKEAEPAKDEGVDTVVDWPTPFKHIDVYSVGVDALKDQPEVAKIVKGKGRKLDDLRVIIPHIEQF